MKWHCGLLDEYPEDNRVWRWVSNPNWDHLPDDVHRELMIWLAMPRVALNYHAHTFGHGTTYIQQRLPDFEDWRDEVAMNWMSATRDDCVKMSRMRPGTGYVPAICQLRALEDLKHMSMADVARDYRVTVQSLMRWQRHGVTTSAPLPSGFELLTA